MLRMTSHHDIVRWGEMGATLSYIHMSSYIQIQLYLRSWLLAHIFSKQTVRQTNMTEWDYNHPDWRGSKSQITSSSISWNGKCVKKIIFSLKLDTWIHNYCSSKSIYDTYLHLFFKVQEASVFKTSRRHKEPAAKHGRLFWSTIVCTDVCGTSKSKR